MNEWVQFAVLVIRGILLWLVVPLAAVSWVVLGPFTKASLGACIGWFDLNLVAFIQRVLLRPVVRRPPASWLPLTKMRRTTHRVALLGLW